MKIDDKRIKTWTHPATLSTCQMKCRSGVIASIFPLDKQENAGNEAMSLAAS